jgi:hypothetical protein
MSRITFLAPEDLAETIYATAALDYVARETDALSILCLPGARSLFRAWPNVRAMGDYPKAAPFSEALRLLLGARGRADIVLDLRAGAHGSFGAGNAIQRGASEVVCHVAEEFSVLVGAQRTLKPALRLDQRARDKAASLAPGTLLALAPGGSSSDKCWQAERFAAVARRLYGGLLPGAQIVVVGAGARDQGLTQSIVASLESDGIPARDLGREFDLLDCAALMERATLCIGNDNALAHIAATMGAATLCLFGPTDERLRGPLGARARGLRAMALAEVAALGRAGGRAAMDAIGIDAVEAAAIELLHAGGLG